MDYAESLVSGTLTRRYKRFLADVVLDGGGNVTAHCPNTGRMTGCSSPGQPVRLSPADKPSRKLKWTLEQVYDGRSWVGVNTIRANHVVKEAIETGTIAELGGYETIRPEQRYGERSRIDLLLSGHPERPDQLCYVEVKNTTLGRGDVGLFPDAVTERGRRHLIELQNQVALGHRGVVLFCVQREDSRRFQPADDVDPEYGRTLREAIDAGVEAIAYGTAIGETSVRLVRPLPVELDGSVEG